MKTEKVVVNPRTRDPCPQSTLKRWMLLTRVSQCLTPGWTAKDEARMSTGVGMGKTKTWTPWVRGTCGIPSQMIHFKVVNNRLTFKKVAIDSRMIPWQQCENERILIYSQEPGFGVQLGFETYLHNGLVLWYWINSLISLSLSSLIYNVGITVLHVLWDYHENLVHVTCLSQCLVSVNAPHMLSVKKKKSDPGKKLEQWSHFRGEQIQ